MAEPLMDTNPAELKVVSASNDEAENSKCSGYCARLFTRIFRTEHIKTKVFVIYFIISIIVILALLSVVVHAKSDNTPPYSMLDNMDKEFLNVPCQVVNQAQYPPVRKESDDMCFYTKENITNILNATRKSTYKICDVDNETLAGLEMTNHSTIYFNTREQNFSICLPINDYKHVTSKSYNTFKYKNIGNHISGILASTDLVCFSTLHENETKLFLVKRGNRYISMTSNTITFCEACDYRGIKQKAVVWCHDCEEAFCSNCADHHSSARKTREHMVVSIDNYKKLPASVRELSTYCEQHNAPFQNYCITHEQLCCRKCIDPLHSRCTSLPAVDDFLKDTKRSFLTEQLAEGFKDIYSFCEYMVKEKRRNLREINNESNRIENIIKQIRKQLNEHLDILEAQRKTALSTHKTDINIVIEQLSKCQQCAGEFKDSLSFMTENASNMQVFLASKKFEQDLQKAEESVTSLQTQGALNNIFFCFDDIMVKNIDRGDFKLGSFSVKTLPAGKTYVKQKAKEIQMFMVTQKPTISSVKLTLLRKLPLPDGMSITGCVLLLRGGIIITGDFYVVFLDWNGSVNKKLQLRMAYDVTCIDDNRLAITDDAEITFIDRNRKEVIKRIRAEGYGFGISHINGSIIYTTDKSKVKKMDLRTERITTLNVGDPIYQSYVVGSQNKIFYSNWQEHTVICYDINGSALWKFKDETVLRNPSGISVDNNCNVFVAGLKSNNVVVLSPNGKLFKQKSLDGDGISNPRAISLDKENALLLVCSERSHSAIYKVE